MYNIITIHIMSHTSTDMMATIESLQEQYYKINNKKLGICT